MVTTDYIFAIPPSWADENTPGMYLATGRYQDGGQGAQGPALIAYGPWLDGNPPARGSKLSEVPLLLYSPVYTGEGYTLDGYRHSDEWTGGSWLTAGDKAAVVLVGTKGLGNSWYGYSDGTVHPDVPSDPALDRGWWSDRFEGQILFYDPADLADVARGEMDAYEPQPYATLVVDPVLYAVTSTRQWHHVGAAAFDRERAILYLLEPLVDEDKPLVHVWQIRT